MLQDYPGLVVVVCIVALRLHLTSSGHQRHAVICSLIF